MEEQACDPVDSDAPAELALLGLVRLGLLAGAARLVSARRK